MSAFEDRVLGRIFNLREMECRSIEESGLLGASELVAKFH
jgi:hypothetical protein